MFVIFQKLFLNVKNYLCFHSHSVGKYFKIIFILLCGILSPFKENAKKKYSHRIDIIKKNQNKILNYEYHKIFVSIHFSFFCYVFNKIMVLCENCTITYETLFAVEPLLDRWVLALNQLGWGIPSKQHIGTPLFHLSYSWIDFLCWWVVRNANHPTL